MRQFNLRFSNAQKHFALSHLGNKFYLMKFKRDSRIASYLAGKTQINIQHLTINKSCVSQDITNYRDTGQMPRKRMKKIIRST